MHEHQHHHGGHWDPRAVFFGLWRGQGCPEQRFDLHRDWGDELGRPPARDAEAEHADDRAFAADDFLYGHRHDMRGGGPFGRGRPPFGFGRGPRPERPLEQGDLRWLVLDIIAAQPRHGYEIIKEIEEMTNGHYSPSPGVIYPTLTFLEETGLIASEAQATKKLYSITDQGRAALEENAATIKALRDRIEAVRTRFGAPPAPEMARAMDNLRAAIQVRLSKGELSPESLAAVTAALDRAAGEIERS